MVLTWNSMDVAVKIWDKLVPLLLHWEWIISLGKFFLFPMQFKTLLLPMLLHIHMHAVEPVYYAPWDQQSVLIVKVS